jgi:hypothetical protein
MQAVEGETATMLIKRGDANRHNTNHEVWPWDLIASSLQLRKAAAQRQVKLRIGMNWKRRLAHLIPRNPSIPV